MMNMLPYVMFFFIFFLMANFDVFNINLNKKSRKRVYIIALVLMVLFAGLRWFNVPLNPEPGVYIIFDYSAYEHVYNNPLSLSNFNKEFIGSDNYIRGMDPGYVFISSFFSRYIFTDDNLFFLLLSFVTVLLFAKGLKRNNITYGMFIVFFAFITRLYFQYNFIMMRQAIAMSIVWWAIPLILERKFWKFFLFCILGGLFHFTAFLFIIVYFLPRFKFSNTFLICILPTLLILSVLGVTDRVLMALMEYGLGFVGLGEKAVAYLSSDLYTKGINTLNFLEMVPFLYFAIKYRQDITSTENGRFFFNLFIFYIIFMLITMNLMVLVRISSYYLYSYFFIISFAFKRIKLYGNRVIYGYAFMIYFFVYGIRFIYSNFSYFGYHIFFLN